MYSFVDLLQLEQEKASLTRELAYERQLHQEAIKIQNEQQLKLQQLQHQGILGHSLHLPATSKQVAAIAAQIKINQASRVSCLAFFTLIFFIYLSFFSCN